MTCFILEERNKGRKIIPWILDHTFQEGGGGSMIPSFNNNCNTCVYRMYSSMYVYLGENINENEEEDKGFIE